MKTRADVFKYLFAFVLLGLMGWWVWRYIGSTGTLTKVLAVFGFAVIGMLLFFLLAPDVLRTFGKWIGDRVYYSSTGLEYPERFSRARKHVKEKKYDRAEDEFRRCLKEKPESWKARLELARLYADYIGEYEQAIQEFKTLLNMEDRFEELVLEEGVRTGVRNRMADIYLNKLNRPDLARESLEEITERLPEDHRDAIRARERIRRIE